jgi:hypothetical protein
LTKVFVPSIPFLHLNRQIDRLKRRKTAQATQTFAATPDRIALSNVSRIGDLRFFMVAEWTAHAFPFMPKKDSPLPENPIWA